jgi:hypothetical protein
MADLEKYGFTLDEDDWIEVTEENCKNIIFPKQKIGAIKKIIKIDEKNRWALAFILWDNKHKLVTRWFWSRIGDPNSRGYPTWHILPDELAIPILDDLKSKGELGEEDYDYCIKRLGRK